MKNCINDMEISIKSAAGTEMVMRQYSGYLYLKIKGEDGHVGYELPIDEMFHGVKTLRDMHKERKK